MFSLLKIWSFIGTLYFKQRFHIPARSCPSYLLKIHNFWIRRSCTIYRYQPSYQIYITYTVSYLVTWHHISKETTKNIEVLRQRKDAWYKLLKSYGIWKINKPCRVFVKLINSMATLKRYSSQDFQNVEIWSCSNSLNLIIWLPFLSTKSLGKCVCIRKNVFVLTKTHCQCSCTVLSQSILFAKVLSDM